MNQTRAFVGNIAYQVSESELKDSFSQLGTVTYIKILRDKDTNQSRGIGFVEMSTHEEYKKVLETMNGALLYGRAIRVSPAEEKQRKPQMQFAKSNYRTDGRDGYKRDFTAFDPTPFPGHKDERRERFERKNAYRDR